MPIEFLIDKSRKDLEKLDKTLKELGLVKKQDENSRLLKRMMILAIRASHRKKEIGRYRVEKEWPSIKPAKRLIPYFKPHEIHKLAKLPDKRKFYTISEKEYPLLKAGGYTLVRSVVNGDYKVIEPGLTDMDIKIINEIKSLGLRDDNSIMERLNEIFASMRTSFSSDYFEKIKYYATRDDRLGKIKLIMMDGNVNKITCDGIGKAVHVTYKGRDLETDMFYYKMDEINNVIRALAAFAKTEINEDDPVLDAVMPNGTRVQGILGNNMVTPKFVITL